MSGPFVPSPTTFLDAEPNVPRPSSLILDDPSVVDPVRRRFAPKSNPLYRLRPRSSRKSVKPTEQDEKPARPCGPENTIFEDDNPICLNITPALVSEFELEGDHYEWAVVYENQRGVTIFSTPYYSSLSLLPADPSPFTLPNASKRRSEQPPITLDNYPLPDGNWRWVSRCWMIDMRSDSGEVQHDGFEYNWVFRKHKWRAQVHSFSAGGLVRRRRWIRLMVRTGIHKRHDARGFPSLPSSDTLSSNSQHKYYRHSVGSSLPASVLTSSSSGTNRWRDMNPDDVWLGDSVEGDWQRCHHFMKRFGRDGRKLEVWRLWLGYYHPDHKDLFTIQDDKGKRREKQWTEDEALLPSEMAALEVFSQQCVALAPRQYLIPVLRQYGQRIVRSFIYPDSRAEFLKLLALSNLLPELDIPFGKALDSAELDFWSYANEVEEKGVAPRPTSLIV